MSESVEVETNVQMWAYCGGRKTRFTYHLEDEEKEKISDEPQVSGLTKNVDGNSNYQEWEV